MIYNDMAAIKAKDADRVWLAKAIEDYQGPITVIDKVVVRAAQPESWNRSIEPRAPRVSASESKMADTIKSLAEAGHGIGYICQHLSAGPRRIQRIAKAAGISLPHGRCKQVTALGIKARAAVVENGNANRAALAEKLRPLASQGLTINEMHDATGSCRRTIMRTISEFAIVRGPRARPKEVAWP